MVEETAHDRSAKENLVISLKTVGSPEFESLVNQLEEAKKVPLVRTIGEPEKTVGSFRAVGWLVLSGAVGGLLAWIVWGLGDPLFDDFETATVENVFGTVSVAVLVGMTLVIGDTLRAGAAQKLGQRSGIGIGAALASGLILGAIGSYFYISGVDGIIDNLVASGLSFSDDRFFDNFVRQNQLNRGIAWSLIGLSAGLTVGIASLQWKRMLITGGGGLVGGFFGGFLFDMMPGQDTARILGLLITGLSIGAMIALTEEATKTSWVEITQGGMAGKRFILYKTTISLGSSPSADITLIKDIAIPAIAAVLEKRGGTMRVTSVDPHQPVLVNNAKAAGGRIRDGDTFTIAETTIRYRERGGKAVRAGILKVGTPKISAVETDATGGQENWLRD
jgi:hypothetical protein